MRARPPWEVALLPEATEAEEVAGVVAEALAEVAVARVEEAVKGAGEAADLAVAVARAEAVAAVDPVEAADPAAAGVAQGILQYRQRAAEIRIFRALRQQIQS